MGPPSQGRNPISLRCSRHFSVYYINPYSAESLEIIYGEILDWFFKGHGSSMFGVIKNLKSKVIKGTIVLYNKIKYLIK